MSETTTTPTNQGEPEALGEGGIKALAAERTRADEAEKRERAATARVGELETQVQSLTDAANSAAEAHGAELKQKQDDIDKLGLRVSRLTIGIEEKLPLNLIDRMQGDDEETLRADAKELAGYVPDNTPSPFPKADPSQGAKENPTEGTNADRFASFIESKLS